MEEAEVVRTVWEVHKGTSGESDTGVTRTNVVVLTKVDEKEVGGVW